MEEYVVTSFSKNFVSDQKNVRTVVYGTGALSNLIMNNYPNFEVCGFLDGYRSEGQFMGRPIITVNELITLKIDRVIILAQPNNVKTIYKRIAEICKKNQISVFDINGVNLHTKYMKSDILEYKSVSYESLLIEIDQHDVISFDIFDTIIMRKVFEPTDIFDIIEDELSTDSNFAKKRCEAERELFEKSSRYPTYERIYSLLQYRTKWNDSLIAELKKEEYEYEKKYTLLREKVYEAYRYAISKGKRVYFVSDMYFSKKQIIGLLNQFGINQYKDILVSSEYGCMKTGGLFTYLKNMIGDKKCLHIGDNIEADYYSPLAIGIDAFLIHSARDMLRASNYQLQERNAKTVQDRLLLGMIVSVIFNNPFRPIENGVVKNLSNYEFAYLTVAPIIIAYMIWLINDVRISKPDGILFTSRDGYLLEKLYALVREDSDPIGYYFYVSRFPARLCGIYTKEDVLNECNLEYYGDPQEMLVNRFLLDEYMIDKYLGEDKSTYLLKHSDIIIEEARKLREEYSKYLEKNGIHKNGKYICVDLAASGTCQMFIDSLLVEPTRGKYFVRINTEKSKENLNIESFYEIKSFFVKEANLCEYYIVLENILTSFEGTMRSIKDGLIIFCEDDRSDVRMNQLKEMHNAITASFDEYYQYMKCKNVSVDFADSFLELMSCEKSDLSEISFLHERMDDLFFGRSYDLDEYVR